MSRILILDDQEARHDWFRSHFKDHMVTSALNYLEAVNHLVQDDQYDIAYLDHDLGIHHLGCRVEGPFGVRQDANGQHLAHVIIRDLPPEKRPREVVVHSVNYAGATAMIAILQEGGIKCHRWPFSTDD